jgi:hypothetical protein
MKKDSAKKLLQVLGKPLLLEFLKGVVKAAGFFLIAHLLR